MAIRIITGIPGSGKTYYGIFHLVGTYCTYNKNLQEYRLKKGYTIISNIEQLKIQHLSLEDCIQKSGKGFEGFFTVDYQKKISIKYKKIIYFLDEAQQFLHQRFYDKDVFYYFQYHRHLGHDVYLITQDSKLLPKALTTLAENEIRAIRRSLSFFGEMKYNVLASGEIIDRKMIRKKKALFNLYQSQLADESEKVKNPFTKYLVLLAIFMVGGIIFFKYNFLTYGDDNRSVLQGTQEVSASTLDQYRTMEPEKSLIWVEASFFTLDTETFIICPIDNQIKNIMSLPYEVKIFKTIKSMRIKCHIPQDKIVNKKETENEKSYRLNHSRFTSVPL